jgi:hypothetical protein
MNSKKTNNVKIKLCVLCLALGTLASAQVGAQMHFKGAMQGKEGRIAPEPVAAPWGMTLDMTDVTNRKMAALRTYVICRENASALGNSQTMDGGYPIQNARRQCDANLENSLK